MSSSLQTYVYNHKPGNFISIQIPVTTTVDAENMFNDIAQAVNAVLINYGYDTTNNDEHHTSMYIMDTQGNAVY